MALSCAGGNFAAKLNCYITDREMGCPKSLNRIMLPDLSGRTWRYALMRMLLSYVAFEKGGQCARLEKC